MQFAAALIFLTLTNILFSSQEPIDNNKNPLTIYSQLASFFNDNGNKNFPENFGINNDENFGINDDRAETNINHQNDDPILILKNLIRNFLENEAKEIERKIEKLDKKIEKKQKENEIANNNQNNIKRDDFYIN